MDGMANTSAAISPAAIPRLSVRSTPSWFFPPQNWAKNADAPPAIPNAAIWNRNAILFAWATPEIVYSPKRARPCCSWPTSTLSTTCIAAIISVCPMMGSASIK